MILSDQDIKEALRLGRVYIDPLCAPDIQPASVDLHLGSSLLIPMGGVIADPMNRRFPAYHEALIEPAGSFQLYPNGFILGQTLEDIALGADITAKVEGISTMARLGLLVHITAGYVDPGWTGQLTLELKNISENIILLRPGMRICQISFIQMTSTAERLYGEKGLGSKYTGRGTEAPKAA